MKWDNNGGQPIRESSLMDCFFVIKGNKMKLFVYDWTFITKRDLYVTLRRQGIDFDLFSSKFSPRVEKQKNEFENCLAEALNQKKYDAIFSINFFPELAKAAHDRGMLYICWTYDSPALGAIREYHLYETNRIFVFDSYECELYKKAGVPNLFYLPLAVDIDKWKKYRPAPMERMKYRADVSLVGQLYQSDMDQIYPLFDEYGAGYIAALINTQLNVHGANIIDELINENVMKRLCNENVTKALLKNLNDKFLNDVEELRRAPFVMFLQKAVTNKERVLLLSMFGRHFFTKLYAPDKVEIPGVTSCGIVDYETRMPIVFKCSNINLNITLRTIRNGIPQRVLDILGCGALALTNYQQDMEEYFEDGKNILIYHSVEEAMDKAKYYLSHEKEAEKIRMNGYKLVKDEFNYERRLNAIWKLSGIDDLLKR